MSYLVAASIAKRQLWFRHKLMIGSFLILTFSVFFGVYCLRTVRSLEQVVEQTFDQAMVGSSYAQSAKFNFSRFDQSVEESLLSSASTEEQSRHLSDAEAYAENVRSDIRVAAARALGDANEDRLDSVVEKTAKLLVRAKEMAQAPNQREELAHQWMTMPEREEIYTTLTDISKESAEMGFSFRTESQSLARRAQQTIFSLIVCTAGLIFGVVLMLLTTALPPLKVLTEACGDVAQGKLFRRAEVATQDEFGLLSKSFNVMVDRIETKDRNLASLLNAIPEAVFFFDKSGQLSRESSPFVSRWFTGFKNTQTITDFFAVYLGQDRAKMNQVLSLLWAGDDHDGIETIFGLLPEQAALTIGEKVEHLRFHYRPQFGFNSELERVLVVVQNVSAEIEAQRARAAQENHIARILNLTSLGLSRCQAEMDRQVGEIAHLIRLEGGYQGSDYLKRVLHGFKGSLSVLGFAEVASLIHGLETQLQTSAVDPLFHQKWQQAQGLLDQQMRELSKLLKANETDKVKLSRNKVEHLHLLAERLDDGELTALLQTFKSVDFGDILGKYHGYVQTASLRSSESASGQSSGTVESKEMQLQINVTNVELTPHLAGEVDIMIGHLIRNSIDHGIEPQAERISNQKPPVGVLSISGRVEGGRLELSVSDDGRGIDAEKLKRRAVELGLWDQEHAAVATDKEAMTLIFKPAFSTREVVSEISGRGVGLDAVKSMVEALGGELSIESKVGWGTRFQLQIPLINTKETQRPWQDSEINVFESTVLTIAPALTVTVSPAAAEEEAKPIAS